MLVGYSGYVNINSQIQILEGALLTVLDPELEMGMGPFAGGFNAYGSGIPREISCFRLTKDAAIIANVVRTAPMPHENTKAVSNGSVALITRRYASR